MRSGGIPVNPRHRDKKKFAAIIESIKTLGLKKPIQVSVRAASEPEGPGYDLVCGQGRIEACQALGFKEIPVIVVELSKEERLLRSLVENIARRYPAPRDLIREIERLRAEGYSNVAIGKKLGIPDVTVGGFIALKKAGEERLIEEALAGKIPIGVAMDIAKTKDLATQRALLKVYESKQLNQAQIRALKRILEQRRFLGKKRGEKGKIPTKKQTSAEGLVNAYRRESQRQKLLVKKAKICDAKLLFLVTAFKKLSADENFINLLRAESLATMPQYLWTKITVNHEEAA